MSPSAFRQRGLSIIEMMVGITIGLIVVAAASTVMVSQLRENRRLLTDVQMQQDLRAAADIITRELRRSGAWAAPQTGVWSPTQPAAELNPNQVITVGTSPTGVAFVYARSTGDTNAQHGYRLGSNGVISTRLGSAYQELTDSRTMTVNSFTITPHEGEASKIPCPKACPDDSTDCWPTVTVREFDIAITATSASDTSVQRSIRSSVRVRNDWLRFNYTPSSPTPTSAQVCPP
jgi:prepilin-type N-terminal cleavage/methylation domain-containing protein